MDFFVTNIWPTFMVKGFVSAEQNLAHHWAAQEELGWVGKCLLKGESKGHSATQLIWFGIAQVSK